MTQLDFWYLCIGLIPMAAGTAFVIYGWLFDRPQGRRRCPKCWYEIGRTPHLRCPECGHIAKREKHLWRTRRSVGRICLGTSLVLAGLLVACLPAVQRKGLLYYAPSIILIAVDPTPDPRGGAVARELHRRVSAGELTRAQMRMLARQSTPVDSRYLDECLRLRSRWPTASTLRLSVVDAARLRCAYSAPRRLIVRPLVSQLAVIDRPLEVYYETWRWPDDESPVHDETIPIGILPDGNYEISFELILLEQIGAPRNTLERILQESDFWMEVLTHRVVRHVRIGGGLDEVITPMDGEQVRGFVRDAMQLDVQPNPLSLHKPPRLRVFLGDLREYANVTFGLKLEFVRHGEVVAWAQGWVGGDIGKRQPLRVFQLMGDGSELVKGMQQSDEWSIRVRGDGLMALRDAMGTKYWAGEIVLPLNRIDLRGLEALIQPK